MRIGYFLSCEEYTPAQVVEAARLAEDAGFTGLWISDHFHPWTDAQGQASFVWSLIGAISQVCSLPVTTAVTCPSGRIPGGHRPGGGHLGHPAAGSFRARGRYWRSPQRAHSRRTVALTASPDAASVATFRTAKGATAPCVAGTKVSWAPTRDEALDHAHRIWASSGVPGEVKQVLPSPRHFEQASALVTRDMIADSTLCGRDVDEHRAPVQRYRSAGFDELYVGNMGPHHRQMIDFYAEHVLDSPRRG